MRTEVTAESGEKLLDGKTEFTYCSDKRKKITAEYSVEKTSDDSVRLVQSAFINSEYKEQSNHFKLSVVHVKRVGLQVKFYPDKA